jgi:hypothetical protein
MHHISKALIFAAAICGARTASAGMVDVLIHGNSCVSTTAENPAYYSQFGANNASTTAYMQLSCPLSLPNHNYYSGYIQMVATTRNTGDPVFCRLYATDSYGSSPYLGQATANYNGGNSQLVTGSLSSNASSPYLYLTCHLPMKTNLGKSHLTSIYVAAYY